MNYDDYKTIAAPSEGSYSEKRSRFLSFAFPVKTADEAKAIVADFRKKYYDARHVCWAYMLGIDGLTYRSNDDGEPSSTAGKPILGQIKSNELTDILVIVVRYYGGIELGTSRLTVAYRTAAAEAIAAAEIKEMTVDETFDLSFDYQDINSIMRVIKEEQPTVLKQDLGMTCTMTLSIRKSRAETLKNRLLKANNSVKL
ncbi:MAG: YigZ family protein [Tannerella sp.]|jgi:uncharacterized YigZ family protein|nr:YigZ family protein [Tannerella sp.]